jgi:hypothetical protein
MTSAYRKGLIRVSGYYLTGVFVSLVFHFVWGWEYINLMPRSASIFIFSILVGMTWATLNITRLFCPSTREQNLGELAVHSVIFAIVAAFIISIRIAG